MPGVARWTKRTALALVVACPAMALAPPGAPRATANPQATATLSLPEPSGGTTSPARAAKGGRSQPAPVTTSAASQEAPAVSAIPGARFWGDAESEFLQALGTADGAWLSLSGGSEGGAFGAGLLAGWTAGGTRPEFAVVTGTSTGALIAPYAFLGPRYDDALRRNFTAISAADIFEASATPESLLDTWPLKELLGKRITAELLGEIATEHRRGRRLFVLTTNLDSGRPVVWNMGAIAAHGGPDALTLFRDVLLASSSIPGVFPPVAIAAEAEGRRIEELHSDGTINAPFYVVPESMLGETARLPARDIYVVINGKLSPDFHKPERTRIDILGRSISLALQAGTRASLARVYAAARRNGTGFTLAYVEPGFNEASRGAFDAKYMQALYRSGFAGGRGGAAFRDAPPDLREAPVVLR